MTTFDLLLRVAELKKKLGQVDPTHALVVFTFKLFGLQIQYRRLPTEEAKAMLVAAIQGAARLVPLMACLEAIGLSAARFYAWSRREINCRLSHQSPGCPRQSPSRLSAAEVAKIKDFVASHRFAHFSLTALSLYAKRVGEVFASPTTWSRVVRRLGLRRPRERVHPPKPKIGIRASAPFQIWHLDLTVVRLLDGTRVFVQAVIDNYSRYILAVKTSAAYGGRETQALLQQALARARELGCDLLPTVMVDSGTENLNFDVDGLVNANLIRRLVAQIEIEFSNSVIEAFFRSMKHGYLFLQRLSSTEAVATGVAYYTNEHNDVMPHSAHRGATPLEMVTQRWSAEARQNLFNQQVEAVAARLSFNRNLRCGSCSE